MNDTGVINEHEGRGQLDPEGIYEPNDEEKKLIRFVERLFSAARKHRSNYDKNWLEYYKFFRGQQWNEQRPSYRHSEVINLVFQAIQSVIPIMTDSRPKFQFLPQEPSDQSFTEIMNQVAESDWTKNNWLYRLTEILYDAHFYGTGFGGMYFDPKAKSGLGDICFSSEDPFYCFPDPNARDVNEKSRYFIKAEPIDIEVLKKEYPDKAEYIKADLDNLTDGSKTDLDNFFKLRLPIDATRSLRESSGTIDDHLEKKALKKILWLYSDEFNEKEIVGPDGNVSGYEQTLKYPKGRKIVIAGGVLLEDNHNPYDDGQIPIARCTNYILPREFWGISEVEQLKSPQVIFNKLISFALDVLTLMGNPIWKVPTSTGIDTDNLFNKPGLILEYEGAVAPTREEGVQLQPYVLQLVDKMKGWFDDLSGATDVSRGVTPGGVTAAAAISDLQEAAQTRVRLKSRNLDAFLQQMGQMYISRVLQFRSTPEIIRITGNQDAAQYFKFHIETALGSDGQPQLNEKGDPIRQGVVVPFIHDGNGGGGFSPTPQIMPIKGAFDVSVTTGSSLPFMKAQKAKDAKDLFQAGVIDAEELLKTMDWPNYQSVLNRVKEQQQQAAQAQAMAGPPGKGPPPPVQ